MTPATSSSGKVASLTGLPAELLRHILIDALLCKCDPPICPSVSQDRPRLSTSGGVWIKTRRLEDPALPLLLVNRLIAQHVQAITATERSAQNYAVDVMFVKMAGPWPTWTRVPVLTRDVDTVHATFRIFNPAFDLDTKFDESGPLGSGVGGKQQGVCSFYYLLTSFLLNGPLARSAAQPGTASCQYTIRSLIIDVLASLEGENHTVTGPGVVNLGRGLRGMGDGFSLRRPGGWNGLSSPEPRIEPAEKLALFLHAWVSTFLTLQFESEYATILFEGILDNIELRVNGEVRRHINIEDAFPMAEPRWSLTRGDSQRERFLPPVERVGNGKEEALHVGRRSAWTEPELENHVCPSAKSQRSYTGVSAPS